MSETPGLKMVKGSIVVTAKGTLLAYCEARKGGRGDWGTIDVMLRRSSDGGKTWQAAPADGDLADLPVKGRGRDRLRLRVRSARRGAARAPRRCVRHAA